SPQTAKSVSAFGRRAAAPRDHAGARHRAQIPAARRAVRRRRSDRGQRHSDHRRRTAPPRHRRADHRPQRRADARHRRSRVHHVRGQGPGGRYRARARPRRPRRLALPRPDADDSVARAARTGARMKTGLHQHTALRQDLRINPRLYQAMDLLYMPLLDLEQHLKQELLGNPFLEMIEPEEEVQATAAEQHQNKPEKDEKQKEDEPDWENILLEDRTEHGVPSGSYSDAREYVEPVTVESKDLIDHLREQTRMLDLTPRQQLLAEEFLGNIGEDGYLQHTLEEILKGANQLLEEHEAESELELNVAAFTLAEVEAMLHVIQQLDPPGIGARNLRECLMLQLESQKRTDSLVYRLVKDAFDDLIAHRWSDLGKRFGLAPEEVQRAADELARLDPKPGLQYSAANDAYIIPDLIV